MTWPLPMESDKRKPALLEMINFILWIGTRMGEGSTPMIYVCAWLMVRAAIEMMGGGAYTALTLQFLTL